MKESDKEFYRGVAMVVSFLIRYHGMPSIALDALKSNGIALKTLLKADLSEFDAEPIRKLQLKERD